MKSMKSRRRGTVEAMFFEGSRSNHWVIKDTRPGAASSLPLGDYLDMEGAIAAAEVAKQLSPRDLRVVMGQPQEGDY